MARWLIALQHGELLKSKSSLTTFWTARPLNDGKLGPWGIGGWVFGHNERPVFFAVGAAKSAFAIYPNDDLAVVVLTNLSAACAEENVSSARHGHRAMAPDIRGRQVARKGVLIIGIRKRRHRPDLVEAISDQSMMNARAHAWATADLAALSAIPSLPDPGNACTVAFLESTIAKDIVPEDIAAQMHELWMNQAEKSLAKNASTLAILRFSQLTSPDGRIRTQESKAATALAV
jgi:hypothetical protein